MLVAEEVAERCQRGEWSVFEVRESGFGERQGVGDGFGGCDCRGVHEENDTLAVTAREPLLDLAVEVQPDGDADFLGHGLLNFRSVRTGLDGEAGEDGGGRRGRLSLEESDAQKGEGQECFHEW